jgi:hypothetical protein
VEELGRRDRVIARPFSGLGKTVSERSVDMIFLYMPI